MAAKVLLGHEHAQTSCSLGARHWGVPGGEQYGSAGTGGGRFQELPEALPPALLFVRSLSSQSAVEEAVIAGVVLKAVKIKQSRGTPQTTALLSVCIQM